MLNLSVAAAGFVALLCSAALVQEPAKPADRANPARQADTVPALNDAATKAYRAKDYATFLDYEKRVLALEPGNPRTFYNIACGEALTGHADAAMQLLNRLVAKKLDVGTDTDSDFAAIRDSNNPAWTSFVAKLATLGAEAAARRHF